MTHIKIKEIIKSYTDIDATKAFKRIAEAPQLKSIYEFVFKDESFDELKNTILSYKSRKEFQEGLMYNIIQKLLSQSSDSYTYSGLENIDRNKPYLFISNHRDIILDPAIMQLIFMDTNIETTNVTLGENLMTSDFVVDIGMLNKMFRVIRSGNTKDFLNGYKILSDYIRKSICNKKESVWLAQGNGRAKDGNDVTEPGLIKMLNFSGKNNFIDNISDLNILPYSISYEFEPCDDKKVQETYLSARQKYKKSPKEDFLSIIAGLKEYKGRIHYNFNKPITRDDIVCLDRGESNNDIFTSFSIYLEKTIQKSYKLFPNNFIAYDVFNNSEKYSLEYTLKQKEDFLEYVKRRVNNLNGEKDELMQRFFELYANPVKNKEEV